MLACNICYSIKVYDDVIGNSIKAWILPGNEKAKW